MKIFSEIVKILDVEPFQAGEGDLYRFRLEVWRQFNTDLFFGTVYRLETYRFQPTFPQQEGQLPGWQSDALVHVIDDNYDSALLSGRSDDEVIDKFQRLLTDRFNLV